jgi:1-acyl-sn-glycerol-3-phosphate acyltransferase
MTEWGANVSSNPITWSHTRADSSGDAAGTAFAALRRSAFEAGVTAPRLASAAVAIVPRVRHLIAIPRTVLTAVVGFFATLVAAPTAWMLAHRDPKSRHVDTVIRRWANAWLWAAGCRLEVEGIDKVDRSRSHIVVANHLSLLDIMACFAAVPLPIRYLAKKELFQIPILAPAMRAVGIVEVDRGGRAAAIQSVNRQSAPVIERGHSLIIYPEGTRSRDGALHDFKKGAFTMAIGAGMPLLPVTIHGSWEAWQPHTPWVFGGQTIRVVIDEAIETAGLDRHAVGALRDQAHETIATNLKRLGGSVATTKS